MRNDVREMSLAVVNGLYEWREDDAQAELLVFVDFPSNRSLICMTSRILNEAFDSICCQTVSIGGT